MYRETTLKLSLICVLSLSLTGLAQSPDPGLMGWWKLDDEGSGTVSDYSGNGRDGTINGSPQFVPGLYGDAMEFHGEPDYVTIEGYKGLLGGSAFTIAAWIKTEGNGNIMGWGNNSGTERVEFRVSEYRLRVEHGSGNRQGNTVVSDNEWRHVVLAVQENATISYPDVTFYVDGEDDTISGTSSNAFNLVENYDVKIARSFAWSSRWFIGLLDDVRLYDRVLSADEIKALAIPPIAGNPSPAEGATLSDTWASFEWSAGLDAVSHDVYIADNLNDVAAGAAEAFLGNQDAASLIVGFPGFPFPDGLVMGTTYYWRIDEKQADGTTVPGSVWSFRVPDHKAENPAPTDGETYVDVDVTLSWHNGFGIQLPHVYFGDNLADVEAGTPDTYKGVLADAAYSPESLAADTMYYWRVDEFDGLTTHTGDVWSFRTRPIMPVYHPNLVAWWKLDDDRSGIVVDSSGNNHYGTPGGDPQYVTGFDGDALELDGSGDFVQMDGYKGILGTSAFTITAWIKTAANGEIVGWGGTGAGQRVEFRVNGGRLRCETNGGDVQGDTNIINDDEWHHVAVAVKESATISSGDVTFYVDGRDDTRVSTDTDVFNMTAGFDVKIGQMYDLSSTRWFTGLIDDLRIYDKDLSPEEILQTMTGDPRLAVGPSPADGSTPNIEVAASLSWTPGEGAVRHDVYLGTDEQAVRDARPSDTTGTYRGRSDPNNYTISEALEYNRTYYWRVDEVETDETTINQGRIWSFTTADFIIIDDFELYNAQNPIWESWHDGLGFVAQGTTDVTAGNGSGSIVGADTTASTTEETVVFAGSQSMPVYYNNNKQDSQQYSEVAMTLSSRRDWTAQGVETLSIWFRGNAASVGSFVEGPAGTYTMISRGDDIWDTSDEFHFAYKQLTGVCSIVAKVESVGNSHNWAKAGVMIRDSLDPDSIHAMMVVTPAQGVSFQRRTVTGDVSFGDTVAGITTPQWVKIERDLGGMVTASYSNDGNTWTPLTTQIIAMNPPLYIGLALTSHDADIACEAKFSNVQITGSVGPQWLNQDIGVLSNDPEPIYVALTDGGGTAAVVFHDDPSAAQTDAWTEWNIDLAEFGGVNLTNIDSIAIGLGDRDNPQPGGSGMMYFDNIRLYRPR